MAAASGLVHVLKGEVRSGREKASRLRGMDDFGVPAKQRDPPASNARAHGCCRQVLRAHHWRLMKASMHSEPVTRSENRILNASDSLPVCSGNVLKPLGCF